MPHEHPTDRLADLFSEAMARPPGPERDLFLAGLSEEDAMLRQEVCRLLEATVRAGGFMQRLPAEEITPRETEKPGDRIGPYTLLEKLGEGGCGVVYKAEREAPLRRTVALKIIKAGMDTKSVVARFEAERQALALMEHPHIAQVYEAGTTDSGRPYFAMELVHGVPITDFCNQRQLSAAERLQLFVKVCHGVQHAHQKGVIHRDIKPANVMVVEEDGAPAPKIIDFGIAKAMGPQLTEQTIITAFEYFIGTPAYMSPEQIAGTVMDIDTRSDIYSLGALLYEMLTGCPPFDQRRMLEAGLDEMRRVIREDEPARPSTCILRRTTVVPDTTAAEPAPPASPDIKDTVHRLRGDLDWVILKCLEKDRERRYSSANSLAGDVERHLRNEPVLATPPSLAYRLRKLALRHKTAVVAGLVVFIALVAGLVATTWGMLQARRAEREAARQLCDSLVAQARATRLSGQAGRRFESLELLQRARGIARDPGMSGQELSGMRNAVTSALSASDLRLAAPWVTYPADADEPAFDESHSLCAIALSSGECSLRRVDSDTEVYRIPGTGRRVHIAMNPNGRYLMQAHYESGTSSFAAMHIWELGENSPRRILDEPRAQHVDFRNSELLALVDTDGSVRIFGLPDAKVRHRLPPGKAKREIRLALHPAEPLVAVSSYFGEGVEVRNFETGETVQFIAESHVTGIAWTPGGGDLAVALQTRQVKFYNLATGKPSAVIDTQQAVTSIAFTRDGRGMAVNGWTSVVEVMDTTTGEPVLIWPSPLYQLRFSPDGTRLAAGLLSGRLGIFDVGLPAARRRLIHRDAPPNTTYFDIRVHPGGRLVAAAMSIGLGFWDLSTGREEAFLPATDSLGFRLVLFDPDGNLLACDREGVSRRPVSRDAGPGAAWGIGPPAALGVPLADQMTLSRDGRLLATSYRAIGLMQKNAGARISHLDRSRPPLLLEPGVDIFRAAISPDGKWVVTSEHGTGVLKVWNAWTGEPVKRLEEWAAMPCFSGDSRWLLTSGRDGRLYSTETWKPVRHLAQRLVIPAPSGNLAAAAGETGIHLIDFTNGREIAFLERPALEYLTLFLFSPDGTSLFAIGEKRGFEVWDLRLIREKLKAMDLDWDWPEFPPAPAESSTPARLKVNLPVENAPR